MSVRRRKMEEQKVGLTTPWNEYVTKVEALFSGDPEVATIYDADGYVLKILVSDHDKADALTKLMPAEVNFGNVTLHVEVVPCNDEMTSADVYRKAFEGNSAFVDVAEGYGPAQDIAYALFTPDVVQLQLDDISEFDGLVTMTYAELAKSVLGKTDFDGVFISSAVLVEDD